MTLTKDLIIDLTQAQVICRKKGLLPARVRGTKDGVQFTKGRNPRLEQIPWTEFEEVLRRKNLAVYHYAGWLKIGKKTR